MKMLVALTLVFALGAPAVVTAQTPPSGSTPAKKGDAQKAVSRNVTGTVKASSQETVVVSGRLKGKDAEWTFAVEPTTSIRKGGKSIVASDLKPGDTVQVRFTEHGGKAMASSIVVKGGATAKKTKS